MTNQIVHMTTVHAATDTRIFDKQAVSLATMGYDVTLLAHHEKSETKNGVEIRSLGKADSRPERWSHVWTAARRACQLEADLYHIHDPELLPAGLYLAETTGASVVFDIHEDYEHIIDSRDWIHPFAKSFLSTVYPAVQSLISRRFDALITVSKPIAKELDADGHRVEIVRNFPRTNTLPDVTGDIDRDHEFVLAYAGGLSNVRGIMRMLRLLYELRERGHDVGLWCLGRWMSEAVEREARQYIAANNLGDNVRFPGYLDYTEMFRWLRSADVGLALLDLEHYENGIPTKLFEYMYSELPIIGTHVDAAGRFLNNEYYWSVPQSDVKTQADAVETVLNKDTESAGKLARHDVEERFSWEHEFETMERLYADLLKE